ncbi:MAG: four helix bundle protein [Caldilineales bacterium]|nr:four helix bundle protein [Caldilineales bacterium]
MTVRNFRDLSVWQKGVDLTLAIYTMTQTFPSDERYGLVSQLRRAAVSIPSNIAEGHIQSSDSIFARHLETSLGSAAEVDTQLYIAHMIGYIKIEQYDTLHAQVLEVMKMLRGLLKTVRS